MQVHIFLSDFTGCSQLFCIVSTKTKTRITVTIIDVRLSKNGGGCSSTLLNINEEKLRCDPTNFFHVKKQILQIDTKVRVSITKVNHKGVHDRPEMIWIKFEATENVTLECSNNTIEDTVHTQNAVTTVLTKPHTTNVTSDTTLDPVPIIVSVILVVLLAAAASVVVFLWRNGKCLRKPNLKSIFNIGSSREAHANTANMYVDTNGQQTQTRSPVISMPPAGNYLELEPQYTEPEERNSTYAEIPEDNRQPEVENPVISEYDKLGANQKNAQPTKLAKEYSHIKVNEYSLIGHRAHGEGSNRKPLSEYSHIQPGLGFPSKVLETRMRGYSTSTDMSEYSHLANTKQQGRAETGETEEENAYTYDHTEGNINVYETDTYSHINAPKA